MKLTQKMHSFHIPVMGLAFTIDSPARVAQYGIDSVISIMDDDLIEKMRAVYARKFQQPYQEITTKIEDYRARRITSYLDLLDKIVSEKFEKFKTELSSGIKNVEEFLTMLPSRSELKEKLENWIDNGKENLQEIRDILDQYFSPGSIDVNIMTKVDKDNFKNGKQLPVIYNDAHAALRGYAQSTTRSSLVFSAGMNPRLFSYMETFDQFYPDQNGNFEKKIILKVSDFRSAMVQGNLLAKKGLWVSEYRIESGLNCGGHAFATHAALLGPVLQEFKEKKEELKAAAFAFLCKALEEKGKTVPNEVPGLLISVQGGVGTAEEHQFLLDHYQVDAVGWGSPFLLVPEATSVDQDTRNLLANAREKDLYLSNISPLGVPFNTVKGTTNDFYKNKRIDSGKAGSSCPKKYLALSKEYGQEEGICSASKKYQDIKIAELNEKIADHLSAAYQKEFRSITEKACLCVGLANASHLEMGIPVKGQKQGVVVCPGPNMAYFSKEVSLKEMIGHIYGRNSVENHDHRPNFLIKELQLYFDYFENQLDTVGEWTSQQVKKWEGFRKNLLESASYYKELLPGLPYFQNKKQEIMEQLSSFESKIQSVIVGEPELAG